MKSIKKNFNLFIIIIMTIIVVGGATGVVAYNYASSSFSYSNGLVESNVENALKDLHGYSTNNEDVTLKLVTNGQKIEVESGKKYIVYVSVTSYQTQNYKPSISGCTIDKTLGQIGGSYSNSGLGMSAYANAWIVTATSDTITIGGNPSTGWTRVGYYKLN